MADGLVKLVCWACKGKSLTHINNRPGSDESAKQDFWKGYRPHCKRAVKRPRRYEKLSHPWKFPTNFLQCVVLRSPPSQSPLTHTQETTKESNTRQHDYKVISQVVYYNESTRILKPLWIRLPQHIGDFMYAENDLLGTLFIGTQPNSHLSQIRQPHGILVVVCFKWSLCHLPLDWFKALSCYHLLVAWNACLLINVTCPQAQQPNPCLA